MYRIRVHDGSTGLEDPVRSGSTDDARKLLDAVMNELKRLPQEEHSTFEFGMAGGDDLFEIYPVPGHGTVVVDAVG